VLDILEQKVSSLIELARELKQENVRLVENIAQLTAKLEKTEKTLLGGSERIEELDQERELTKNIVNDLIKSIDMLVESEKQR